MKLRVLALALAILAFFIFCGSPFQQAAQAVAIVDDAVIAIIITALAAFGITFAMTGGYEVVKDYIREQIVASGIDFTNGINYGASTVGDILINHTFLARVRAFALFLKTVLGLDDNVRVPIISPASKLDDLTVYVAPVQVRGEPNYSAVIEYSANYSPVYVAFAIYNGGSRTVLFSESTFQTTETYYYDNGDIRSRGPIGNTTTIGRWHVTTAVQSGGRAYNDSYEWYDYSVVTDALLNESQVSNGGGVSLDVKTEILEIPTEEEIAGKGAVIDGGFPWGTILREILRRIPGITVADELEGTDITYEQEESVEDQVSEQATNAEVISDQPTDYQVPGLQSVFPFCIPFDLYNFVACLAADPVAPSFTWRFYVPGICDESIEIDLSEFDAAAQILRTMELLLFCVGLAFVTRKIIRG